jgi:hypothetical protein
MPVLVAENSNFVDDTNITPTTNTSLGIGTQCCDHHVGVNLEDRSQAIIAYQSGLFSPKNIEAMPEDKGPRAVSDPETSCIFVPIIVERGQSNLVHLVLQLEDVPPQECDFEEREGPHCGQNSAETQTSKTFKNRKRHNQEMTSLEICMKNLSTSIERLVAVVTPLLETPSTGKTNRTKKTSTLKGQFGHQSRQEEDKKCGITKMEGQRRRQNSVGKNACNCSRNYNCYNCGRGGHISRNCNKPRRSSSRNNSKNNYRRNCSCSRSDAYNPNRRYEDAYPGREDYCYYHRRFGNCAHHCQRGCNYWLEHPGTNMSNPDHPDNRSND